MNTLEIESTCGSVVNGSHSFTFANVVPVAAIRANFRESPETVLTTAEIVINASEFEPHMLDDNGLPRNGAWLHVVDEVFGDHVYTVINARQEHGALRRSQFRLLCLIDQDNGYSRNLHAE
jgi:hypothetical protein